MAILIKDHLGGYFTPQKTWSNFASNARRFTSITKAKMIINEFQLKNCEAVHHDFRGRAKGYKPTTQINGKLTEMYAVRCTPEEKEFLVFSLKTLRARNNPTE